MWKEPGGQGGEKVTRAVTTHTVLTSSVVIQNLPVTVECLAAWGSRIVVGCAEGAFLGGVPPLYHNRCFASAGILAPLCVAVVVLLTEKQLFVVDAKLQGGERSLRPPGHRQCTLHPEPYTLDHKSKNPKP